jgi:non-ribosomal peptide synthase protein (TIGR01720 family)
MVPSIFVPLAAMPSTPSGKLDREALPAADRASGSATYVAPASEAERELARIWGDLLGLDRVGVHDNFFELGGDSILSIQVVARASQVGLHLQPRHLFQHQTVTELATVARIRARVTAEQGEVTGAVRLTPIQRWFFERGFADVHHFNQAILLDVGQVPEPGLLRRAVERLLLHHDAMRLRFARDESGAWVQRGIPSSAETRRGVFRVVDLTGIPEDGRRLALEIAAHRAQASLDLAGGPLLRVVLFDLGGGAHRLLMAIHHLAVDAVSWRILMEDLLTGYEQLRRGQDLVLPPKTTSYREWSDRLSEYAHSDALVEEAAYWTELAARRRLPLPVDRDRGDNDVHSADTRRVSLTADETRALLQEVPAAYRTRVDEVLLTALVQALSRWVGRPSLLFSLEGHGREELFEDVDLTRTVGWFTALFPMWLDLEGIDDPGSALASVKEQLRRVPRNGIGYGLLRYLKGDNGLAARLESVSPEISFNYLGQVDRGLPAGVPLALAPESHGPLASPRDRRVHLLDVTAGVAGGRLQVEWSFSRNRHEPSTIELLAGEHIESLRRLITHCLAPDVDGSTPSDFPLVDLGPGELEELAARTGGSREGPDDTR